MTQKTVEFPKSLLVRIANFGDPDNEFLTVGTTPSEIDDSVVDHGSVKTARYVLVGTGTIHHSAPVYVEDARS